MRTAHATEAGIGYMIRCAPQECTMALRAIRRQRLLSPVAGVPGGAGTCALTTQTTMEVPRARCHAMVES